MFHEQKYYTKEFLISNGLKDLDIAYLRKKKILIEGKDSDFKFSFVGAISTSKLAFCVLPKIWKNKDNSYNTVQVVNTIESLKSYLNQNTCDYDGVDYFGNQPDDPKCSELAIADFLIKDYKNHGIYLVNEEKVELNGNGDVNWPLTIMEVDPVFSNKQPVYSDTINHVFIDDYEHLTVQIHKWSIHYIIKKYKDLLNEHNLVCDSDIKSLNQIGKDDYLEHHLKKELNSTFSDRGIRLLKSLLFLITKKSPAKENTLTLFGTCKYENVWEDICRKITNGSYEDITEKFEEDYPDKNLFPNPTWNVLDIKGWKRKKVHIPDILSFNVATDEYYLFDAKYYLIKYHNKTITGEPGYHDILKQFLYQQHLEYSLETTIPIKNALLLPILDNEFDALENKQGVYEYNEFRAVIGSITYELFEGKKVYVIMCPFSKWQTMYVNNKSLDFSEIDWNE